jgi:hypothetical protein
MRRALALGFLLACIGGLIWYQRSGSGAATSHAPGQARGPERTTGVSGERAVAVRSMARPRVAVDGPLVAELPSVVVGAAPVDENGEALPAPRLPEYEDFRANNRRYIRTILAPRLAECWDEVEGDGMIELQHTFVIRDGRAYAAPISDDTDDPFEVVSSTLPEDQDAVAIECMRKAVAGTSFDHVPMDPADPQPTLSIYQRWSSPARTERLRAEREAASGPVSEPSE